MQANGLTPSVTDGTAQVATTFAPATKKNVLSPEVAKLKQAAGQFESILLANLWKSMKTSFADDDQDSDSDSEDPAHGTLEDFSIRAMCDAVGKSGGLGIGKLILQHLEPKLHRGVLAGTELSNVSDAQADILK